MSWKSAVVLALTLAAGVAAPAPARAQTTLEVTPGAPQLEDARPSRAVLARRRAGWVLLVGSLPTFLVGFGIARYARRDVEPMEFGLLGETLLPGAIAEGIFFAGMGLLIRSRRMLRRERRPSDQRLAYDLEVGPLGSSLTICF